MMSVMFLELTGSLCSFLRTCLPKSKSDNHSLSFCCSIKYKLCSMKNGTVLACNSNNGTTAFLEIALMPE